MLNLSLIDSIDDLLPQTQCGLCGYGGCRPYAEAIIEKNEAINLCPPGGVKTLNALAELLAQDAAPLAEEMAKNAKPPQLAIIREAECIGCTKCIQACPVDAIIGSAKQMHTVLKNECTGCELCVEPCPVDCIDMVVVENHLYQSQQAKQRYLARNKRISQSKSNQPQQENNIPHQTNKKAEILAAVQRAKKKKQAIVM